MIGVAAIFRDEARYLKEWIEFHRVVGVDKFYLFNHHSVDNYLEVLDPYISSGIVELTDIIPEFTNLQDLVAIQCWEFHMACQRSACAWIALLNSDEFIYPVNTTKLADTLSEYPMDIGQVLVNWRVMGHSNHWLQPREFMIEQLTKCQDHNNENKHVKAIVRPQAVAHISGTHNAWMKEGFRSTNTNMEHCLGPFNEPVLHDKLVINHYVVRDLSYVEQKVGYYKQYGYGDSDMKVLRDRANVATNTDILRYLPKLKEVYNAN